MSVVDIFFTGFITIVFILVMAVMIRMVYELFFKGD